MAKNLPGDTGDMVRSLAREDPTRCDAAKPANHNYSTWAPQPEKSMREKPVQQSKRAAPACRNQRQACAQRRPGTATSRDTSQKRVLTVFMVSYLSSKAQLPDCFLTTPHSRGTNTFLSRYWDFLHGDRNVCFCCCFTVCLLNGPAQGLCLQVGAGLSRLTIRVKAPGHPSAWCTCGCHTPCPECKPYFH